MRRPLSKRKCKHCQTFFDPHPRSAGRQRYCSKPDVPSSQQSRQPTSVATQASQPRLLHRPYPGRARAAVAQSPPGLLATPGRSGQPMRYKMP